jgi:sigma-54 dependent transcriptional regulator, acetoin dehydrogenase operon transcriptional activator AcoR
VDGPIDLDDLPELQASRLPPARSTAAGVQADALLQSGGGSDPDALLQAALRAAHWNVSAVARQMGVARMTLYRRMKRAGIVPPNRMG